MYKIVFKHERLLVNLFYYLLSKGITKPVTEKQYFSIVNETLKRINQGKNELVSLMYVVEEESFEDIVTKANALARCTRNGIELSKYRGGFTARATYDLTKPSFWSDVQINWYIGQQDIFHSVIDAKFNQSLLKKLQTDPVSEEQLSLAKKVAAVYVNELVKKYVDREIEEHRWPSQCRDVDEYVFKRNIATYIDEQGTAEIFCKLYKHTVQVICALIIENKGSFQISNWDVDTLAFANYLKFFDLEELKFLIPLKHDQYKTQDLRIRCTVSSGQARCFSQKCTYYDAYDGDNTYERRELAVFEKEVEIMEKRMACFEN